MAAVLESQPATQVPAGGAFLFDDVGSVRLMTPEAFTEEQRLYLKTALQFSREQVLAKSEAIERKEPGVLRELLRRAGELGLLMIDIPEAHGGLGLDKTTSLILAESMSLHGSWSVTFGAHTGIGSLPIVWFGTEAQKAKYLPKLATAELVAAYALTEQGSGSDALGAKTKAVLSPDGKEWILNGSKLYITNAAFADVFIVFAKVDGDKFTGFIVEKGAPGFSVGPEEHKMGLRGSSTCPLYFEDARIPRDALLGEVGKGHKIAFNILNYGRLKLGAGVLGGMKLQLQNALAFAQERKQFATPIAQFPLTREKLARMVGLIYAVESMTYRTGGLVDARLAGEDKAAPDYDAKLIAAIEEYAIESSIMKVFGSEALGHVVDDAVQIHGGAGYIEEYPVERAYRDARINRIFEGTNEINRMLISGMLLKRTLKGSLPLFQAAEDLDAALARGSLPKGQGTDALAAEAYAAECLKRLAIYALKVAAEAYGPQLEQHQEVLAAVADVVTDAFALDSMVTRTRQCASGGQLDPVRVAVVQAFCTEAHARSFERAKRALCASAQGEALEGHLQRTAQLYRFVPRDPVALRETVVAALEKSAGYPFDQA
ncbi:MAG TPA: acyl-CoA dehydrogenase family protein [Aggregicoccus sp.]|nr:acyl-CoA dehydrogenase family protein [Aggregicoccus sp.]